MIISTTSGVAAGRYDWTTKTAGAASFASAVSSCISKANSENQTSSPDSTGSGVATGSPVASATKGMSIAQIRDINDQMAIDGKLTDRQQMALIGGGLMDPDPLNPGYQGTSGIQAGSSYLQVGYSRSDSGLYDFLGMMQSAASFAASSGLSGLAEIYKGIGQAFHDYTSSSPVDPSA